MATNLEFERAPPPSAPSWRADQQFFVTMNIACALLVVFGFAQFALRGFADFSRIGWWVHLHGVAMLAWLGLNITQARLANRGSITQHRKLGKLGLGLALAIALLGGFTGTMAVIRGTFPPFFQPGYFLALTNLGMAIFFAVIVLAIRLRRDTEWHRRIMLVALIIILEPALGRILPMPLIQPFAQWIEMALQLLVLCVAMLHDLRHRGAVHPAYWAGAALIAGFHGAVFALGKLPAWVTFAEGLRG